MQANLNIRHIELHISSESKPNRYLYDGKIFNFISDGNHNLILLSTILKEM